MKRCGSAAGQRVVVREVVDARLRRMAVAQVAHDRHAHALAVAQHRAHDEFDRDALAVLVQRDALVGVSWPGDASAAPWPRGRAR
jgi:hypothetical protein